MFMKALFTTFCLLMGLGLGSLNLLAQTPTQVIIANGGVFGPGNTVRMAAWNLSTGQYMVFDSFPASSVQHVLVHDRDAFVCADSFVVRYNLDNHQRQAIATVKGARQSAVYQDKLIISKGYGTTNHYVEVRNISDLSLDYSVSGLAGECEGIVVMGDTAYIAEPIGFGATDGKLAVVDLQGEMLHHEIDLDSNGRIIKNLYLHDGTVYSVNQISYFGSYGVISAYDIATGTLDHHQVDLPTSQGAGIYGGKLYAAFGGGVGGWSLNSSTLVDTNVVAGYWAAMALDSVNQRFYVTETDYATYGKLYSYSWAGVRLDSVTIGVSPEAIAVDYNVVTGSKPRVEEMATMRVFPQPCGNLVHVDLRSLPTLATQVEILDITGKVLLKESVSGNGVTDLSTATLAPGTYLLRVHGRGQAWTSKVVKLE